jgi:hypothetical protein
VLLNSPPKPLNFNTLSPNINSLSPHYGMALAAWQCMQRITFNGGAFPNM